MNLDKDFKEFRVFVACPKDLSKERAQMKEIIEEVSILANKLGVTLKLLDWHNVVSDMGRPQQVIFDQLEPEEWDLFIGILWHRFGTRPGGSDPRTNKDFLSGTEEEFRLAYALWKSHSRPRIFFYRCMRPIHPSQIDPEQYKHVNDFLSEFAPDADHPGLYQDFNSTSDFVKRMRQDLTIFLLDYADQKKKSVDTVSRPDQNNGITKTDQTESKLESYKKISKPRKEIVKINLSSSKMVIAVVQMESPFPKGKQRSVIGNRESLSWTSFEEIANRIHKACNILDMLNERHPNIDLVVFPEYSLPITQSLGKLQEKANQFQNIIIAGADSIHQSNSNEVFTQCPVIIPERENPVWITKCMPSKWEYGLIDSPKSVHNPTLTWEADGQLYWLSVYIGLDFSLALQETKKGGGIFIVPLCSPDMNSFRGWADNLLRLENGTATVLCNCVGESSAGKSGVVAIVPDGKPFSSAFELSYKEEATAVFEIDLKHLSPPKKTKSGMKLSIGERYIYRVLPKALGQIELLPSVTVGEPASFKGVVNPALFTLLGKKMRIAFLSVDSYQQNKKKFKNQDFEILGTLGSYDLLITHISESQYDLLYDVSQLIDFSATNNDLSENANDENNEDLSIERLPYFRVDRFFKVLGVVIDSLSHSIFEKPKNPVPNIEEFIQLIKLGTDWNDNEVTDKIREKFLEHKWIFKTGKTQPKEISAIITISLDYFGYEKVHLQKAFEEQVLPKFIENPDIVSIYKGVGNYVSVDYLLKVSSNIGDLTHLQEEIHKMATQEKLFVNTSTFVVIQQLSSLSLEKILLIPTLPANEAKYRTTYVFPFLSEEDKTRFLYLPAAEQQTLISQYRRVLESLKNLENSKWLQDNLKVIKEQLIRGLLHEDFSTLSLPHYLLQNRVEEVLKDFINRKISKGQLELWNPILNIPLQKNRARLSFSERIKLVTHFVQQTKTHSELLNSLSYLRETIPVRNAIVHDSWDRISIDSYVDALVFYCDFLSVWDNP